MKRLILGAAACVLAFAGARWPVQAAAPQRQTAEAIAPQRDLAAGLPQLPRALLDQYCVTCHNQRVKMGGLTLDTLDLANVSANAATWEKVVRKFRTGVMPPAGRPRPDRATYDALASWLEAELDGAAAAKPDPGRADAFHRLNRNEYRNAIRDLLALDVDVGILLPADDASYGFDNIAGNLKLSPTLLERYLSAAQKISRTAVGASAPLPTAETFRVPADLSQEGRLDGLPFGTRGGTLVRYTFPYDAEYAIRLRLARDTEDNIPTYTEPHQLEVSIDGERVRLFRIEAEPEGSKGQQQGSFQKSKQEADANFEVRVSLKAGPRTVGVTFLKKPSAAIDALRSGAFSRLLPALKQPFQRPYVGGFGLEETRSQPYLESVTISGPFDASGIRDTPSRRRIFICRPSGAVSETRCAKTILSTVARRAYRRPITDVDVSVLLGFYREGHIERGFEAGIELALQRVLMTPDFLFRMEIDPRGVRPGSVYRISDLELASRLSFFLWSSIPDDELLDVATSGRLHNRAVVEQQVRRMLADPRAQALVSNFTGQWLYLRNLPAVAPDPNLFPDFDESLRQAFRRETELFFESILRDDRSVLELLTADYTFVNERLAVHYGIPNVKDSHFRRITLADQPRRGLLGHGSILAVTSYPHRTSPVLRGKWILENLLGSSPPPPPPDVPDLKDTNTQGKVLSMRDRMLQHRANPVCASCHATMDPLGFALEQFDAVGQWRDGSESWEPIDSSGALPDGTAFKGAAGLREALLTRPELFVRTFVEKLLVYAFGRGLEPSDFAAVRGITREAARSEYRLTSILMGIVNSTPFRMRRSHS